MELARPRGGGMWEGSGAPVAAGSLEGPGFRLHERQLCDALGVAAPACGRPCNDAKILYTVEPVSVKP